MIEFQNSIAAYSYSNARTTSSASNLKVLNGILEKAENIKKNGEKHLFIFDIDSTLLDTSYRTGGIFKEFARHPVHKEAYPKLCKAINRWTQMVEVYDPIEFVNHHSGISVDASSDTGKYLMSFWRKRFFNPDWLSHDLPYAGSSGFVYKILERGGDIAYLTGREEKSLLDATIRSLATHRFPYNPSSNRTRLMLKSDSSIKDLLYKDEGLSALKKGYEKVYYFENEVELVLMANREHQEIETYLFDSVHSKRAELGNIDIPKITSWSLKL